MYSPRILIHNLFHLSKHCLNFIIAIIMVCLKKSRRLFAENTPHAVCPPLYTSFLSIAQKNAAEV